MNIKPPWTYGVSEALNPAEKKRVKLVNILTLFFLFVGVPISYYTLSNPEIGIATKGYVIAMMGIRFLPLILNAQKRYQAASVVLILLVNYTITAVSIALGSDSNVDLCYIIVAGLPYFILDSKAGNKRLWLSLIVFPLWIVQEVYTMSHPPLIKLGDSAILAMSYFYESLLTVFTIFLYYTFSKLTDSQVALIEDQKESLRINNKQQEQFNYIATHDLKTPVANIEGFYQVLQNELKTESELTDMAMLGLKKSIEQSKGIINDLVEITRSSNIIEEIEVIKLSELTESILTTLSQPIANKNIQIFIDFSCANEIRFGKIAIRSILQNIIGNAVKYTASGRPPIIHVRSKIHNNSIIIEVVDNGIGIDLERHKDKLFKAFQRFHTHEEGSGIGLFMTKRLVEDRGGRIEIESNVNQGSTFRILLPVKMN